MYKYSVLIILLMLVFAPLAESRPANPGDGNRRNDNPDKGRGNPPASVPPSKTPSQISYEEEGLESWQVVNLRIYEWIIHSKEKVIKNISVWTSNTNSIQMNYAEARYFAQTCVGCTTSEKLSAVFQQNITREDVLEGEFKWGVFISVG